jgi:hypothetical protein
MIPFIQKQLANCVMRSNWLVLTSLRSEVDAAFDER